MNDNQDSGRSRFLSILLTAICGMFILSFTILITGRFVLFLMVMAAIVTSMAGLHYLIWGRYLTDRTAGEREEEAFLERLREEELDKKRVH